MSYGVEIVKYLVTINNKHTGVARGVAGVAEATPIFQALFNKCGQKISKSYLPH